MNRNEVIEMLRSWGVKQAFKPVREAGTDEDDWILLTRRPAKIVEGLLTGTEVYIDRRAKAFRVWTCRTRLATAIAAEHGLKIRPLDGEAEVWIPPHLADTLLPRFGAKIKRQFGPAGLARRRELAAKARENSPIGNGGCQKAPIPDSGVAFRAFLTPDAARARD